MRLSGEGSDSNFIRKGRGDDPLKELHLRLNILLALVESDCILEGKLLRLMQAGHHSYLD